ncbi:MAG: hypothetical protein HY848_19090 [Betaproteobacteria bacterium]|nr:hypothetical protein [Betaproteobacteria bacterium]
MTLLTIRKGAANRAMGHTRSFGCLPIEGVPSYVESRALSSGMESQFVVFVLKELAHRARWIVAQLPPTDAELDFLATGKLPGQEEDTK